MSSTLASVRNALQVLLTLRRRGPQRLNDIAAEVGVGTSTAHRLVATLRAEGFVTQNADTRLYELGPALRSASRRTASDRGSPRPPAPTRCARGWSC